MNSAAMTEQEKDAMVTCIRERVGCSETAARRYVDAVEDRRLFKRWYAELMDAEEAV